MRVKRNFNVGMLKELIIENDDQDIYTIAEQQCRVTIQKYLITQDFSKPEQLFLVDIRIFMEDFPQKEFLLQILFG